MSTASFKWPSLFTETLINFNFVISSGAESPVCGQFCAVEKPAFASPGSNQNVPKVPEWPRCSWLQSSFCKGILAVLALATLATFPAAGQAMMQGIMSPPASQRPPGLQHVGIEQHLNEQIPAGLTFHDETGKTVKLGDYFGKKPLILSLVYYQCPMLCSEVLNGLGSALRVVKFDVGKDFDVLTVSFNPKETPEIAAAKKADLLKHYGRAGAAQGWHFLTGSQDSISALTQAAGFQYEYDSKTGQYAHATAIMVLTPEGKIAQYYYGVEYAPKDLRLGLVQASQHKIGNLVDEVLLYCYHYNPDTGKYGAIISRILKLSAGATILVVGTFLIVMFRIGSGSGSARRVS